MSLLTASLLALLVGGFVQLDDTSGYGDEDWFMPLGWLAAVLAVAAVAISAGDRTARRWVGGSLAVLVAALVALSTTDDGFRFVYHALEGELFYLQLVLGLTALTLVLPTFGSEDPADPNEPADAAGTGDDPAPARRGRNGWERATLYIIAITAGMFLAFILGIVHFEASQCSAEDFDGECDLAPLEGIFWAACTLLLGLVGIAIAEVSRFGRRRAARRRRRPIDA